MKDKTLSEKIDELIHPEDVKKDIRRLLEEWKAKCKRMEIMSGDVAYYELRELLEDIFGSDLI